MSIPPGLHVVTIDSFSQVEDRVIAHLLTKQGQILKHNLGKLRNTGKSLTLQIFDEYSTCVVKGQRSLRNRHHKRKEQPNCGPRKPNQW